MVSFLPFVTLTLAGMAVASPLKRAPSFVVSLSTGTASINSVDEINLVATVENTSDQDIKVLKFGTVLDNDLPTNSFTVTRGGQSIPFSGVLIQLSMADLTADSFVTIPAGQSATATHKNIGPLYKFHEAGTGVFTFAPRQDFQVAGADNVITNVADTLRVVAGGSSVDISVAADVAKRELGMESNVEKRARVTCSSSTQNSFISASYSEGKSLAIIATNYIRTYGTSDSLFRAYFGATTSKPLDVFTAVANENSSTRTLSCTDPHAVCGNGVIAYTVTSTTNIYYCSIFYNEVTTSGLCSGTTVASRNVRGGTTLHELTHALSGTTDVGYGCAFDQTLSSNPTRAMSNADNYNCFATQVYANTQC